MVVVLICLVLAPLGIVLVWTGLWPRRRGTTPHCRECGYNLTGLAAERCPECGTLVGPRGPVYGERRRSPVRVIAGVLCLAPVLGGAVFIARSVDWYRYYPAGWVLNDLQSGSPGRSNKAWGELVHRDAAGDLSAKYRSRLIDLCLQQQAANAPGLPTDDMVNYLGRCSLAGRLSEAQQSTFYSQIGQLKFRVRPRVVMGDPVPYRVEHQNRGPSGGWWMTLEDAELFIDGEPTGEKIQLSGGSSSGYGAGGWYGARFRCPPAGHHTAEIRPHVLIYYGQHRDAGDSTLMHRREAPLAATFEVLAEEPPDYIWPVRDPSLQGAMLAAIQPTRLMLRARGTRDGKFRFHGRGVLEIKAVPANVAFEVLLRAGGREDSVAQVGMARGGATNYPFSWTWEGPLVDSYDVILRASGEVARNTVDLVEFWDGELIYEDVPVRLEGATSGPQE